MDKSLTRALRSLVAASALLIGAYSIAGSPNWLSGGQAFVPSVSSVLIAVPQSIGFRETRQLSGQVVRASAESAKPPASEVGSLWIWALTAVALSVILIQRRLMRS